MDAYLPDIILLFLYQSCALLCVYKNHNGRTSLYCFLGASICFIVAWVMQQFPWAAMMKFLHAWISIVDPACIYHLIISLVCFKWARLMIDKCSAKIPAITIASFGLFQIIYSVDRFLYGENYTGLGEHYVTIAIAFHLLIMATYTYGIVIRSRVGSGAIKRSTAI